MMSYKTNSFLFAYVILSKGFEKGENAEAIGWGDACLN